MSDFFKWKYCIKRLNYDFLQHLCLDCRQYLPLYVNRNTSSLPSPPDLPALQIILRLEVQAQCFLHSLSITNNITAQVIHSTAPVQLDQTWSINSLTSGRVSLQNIKKTPKNKTNSQSFICDSIRSFYLFNLVAAHLLLQGRNIF